MATLNKEFTKTLVRAANTCAHLHTRTCTCTITKWIVRYFFAQVLCVFVCTHVFVCACPFLVRLVCLHTRCERVHFLRRGSLLHASRLSAFAAHGTERVETLLHLQLSVGFCDLLALQVSRAPSRSVLRVIFLWQQLPKEPDKICTTTITGSHATWVVPLCVYRRGLYFQHMNVMPGTPLLPAHLCGES